MEHTKVSHHFYLCHLAKRVIFLVILSCCVNTLVIYSKPPCTQQMFSTSSGPGNGLKIHMRNFLTSSQKLICSHVQTLWHSMAHLQNKQQQKNHFIAFLFQVKLCLSHSSVQKFQSYPPADVSLFEKVEIKSAIQRAAQYLRVNVYQRNVLISN